MEVKNLDNLKFIRCLNPKIIPRHLIDQIKEKDYTTDWFYKFSYEEINNPKVFIHILVDKNELNKKIYGFLWAEFECMTNSIFIHSFSVEKELWHIGKTLNVLSNHLRSIKEKLNCKVRWLSNRPKLFERMGFHKTKTVMFEEK